MLRPYSEGCCGSATQLGCWEKRHQMARVACFRMKHQCLPCSRVWVYRQIGHVCVLAREFRSSSSSSSRIRYPIHRCQQSLRFYILPILAPTRGWGAVVKALASFWFLAHRHARMGCGLAPSLSLFALPPTTYPKNYICVNVRRHLPLLSRKCWFRCTMESVFHASGRGKINARTVAPARPACMRAKAREFGPGIEARPLPMNMAALWCCPTCCCCAVIIFLSVCGKRKRRKIARSCIPWFSAKSPARCPARPASTSG